MREKLGRATIITYFTAAIVAGIGLIVCTLMGNEPLLIRGLGVLGIATIVIAICYAFSVLIKNSKEEN